MTAERGRGLFLALSLVTAACSGGGSVSPSIVLAPSPVRIDVTPGSASINPAATIQLSATVYDQNNSVLSGYSVSWSSSNEGVATVNSGGLVSGVAPGSVTIRASAAGLNGTASITVSTQQTGTVTRVQVSPATASVNVGATTTLTATAYDAQNNVISGRSVAFSSSNTAVATVNGSGVVSGIAVGSAAITATIDGVIGSSTVTVLSLPSGNVIDVNTGQTFQTINGWEGTGSIGEVECDQTAFQNYKGPVIDRLANELGINRVRLQVRSGYEAPVDYFLQYRSGQITYAQWQATWYTPVNDNTDPNNANSAGFQWGWLDYQIDEVVVPLRQKLQARGEKLYVNFNYIDFKQGKTKSFIQIKQPQEYAEFIAAAFQHIRSKYGWTPDALELILEPSNAGDINTGVYGTDLGPALVAAANRLSSLGFNPEYIAPSDASMSGSVTYYDQMILTPGVLQHINELSYHRYQGVSLSALQAIAFRGQRDHIRTAMLEWNQGVNIDTLIEDLTVGNVSAWQQFSMAFCGQVTNPSVTGIYYQINQSNPANPIVTMSYNSRDYRQIFLYVRAGAVRLGATSSNPTVISTVAFRNTNGKYVAVARSQSAASFSIRGMPAGTYGVNFNSQQQNGVELGDLTISAGGTLTGVAPEKGVMTFYQK